LCIIIIITKELIKVMLSQL